MHPYIQTYEKLQFRKTMKKMKRMKISWDLSLHALAISYSLIREFTWIPVQNRKGNEFGYDRSIMDIRVHDIVTVRINALFVTQL